MRVKNNDNIDLQVLAIVNDELQSDSNKIKFGDYAYYKILMLNLLEKVNWYEHTNHLSKKNLLEPINNLNEAFTKLVELIRWKSDEQSVKSHCEERNEKTYNAKTRNGQKLSSMEKICDLHVYNDGTPMKYISASASESNI